MAENALKIINEHFKLADRFLQSAQLLEHEGDLRSAIDRAYYAMYHAAAAAVHHKGILVKSHKGLHQQFSKEYVKSRLISEDLGGFLLRAFDLRQLSDYQISATIEDTQAEAVLIKAREFVNAVKNLLLPAKREPRP